MISFKFPRMYKFCNGNLNEFVFFTKKRCLSLWVYVQLGKFNETSLPLKKDFYSELSLEDVSDKDYFNAQKVFEEFYTEISDYQSRYVCSVWYTIACRCFWNI